MSKITDPIADLLTRVRNGQQAKHAEVLCPGSKIKLAVAKLLAETGYVESVEWVDEGYQGQVRVRLRYDKEGRGVIRSLKRESKPSRRLYVGAGEIPRVLNGMGVAIMSTSKGVITGKQARAAKVGGELLCSVY